VDNILKMSSNQTFYSNSLVILIQVFFAVVVGAGLIEFHSVIFAPQDTIPFYALIVVFITAITSWTGYHASMKKYPYTHTLSGMLRLYCDIFIVVAYSFLLFAGTSKELLAESYLVGFSVVFLLYIGSGLFRRAEYKTKEASETPLLLIFFILSTVVTIAFVLLIRYTEFK